MGGKMPSIVLGGTIGPQLETELKAKLGEGWAKLEAKLRTPTDLELIKLGNVWMGVRASDNTWAWLMAATDKKLAEATAKLIAKLAKQKAAN